MAEYFHVANLDEVPHGARKQVFVDDEPAVLLNVGGVLYCIADVCSHDGGPLVDGELDDHRIECPRHGALFDIRTGKALALPATAPTTVYQVKVVGDRILVAQA